MRKTYVSPLFAELELEAVLWSSNDGEENDVPDIDWGNTGGDGGEFDGEDEFEFNF